MRESKDSSKLAGSAGVAQVVPLSLPVWCRVTWRRASGRGHLQPPSAVHLPQTWCSSEAAEDGSLVTRLPETADVSKTGAKDDAVLLDSDHTRFLEPALRSLSKGNPMTLVWNFDYTEDLKVFNLCAQDLQVNLVPYQARHSGPSRQERWRRCKSDVSLREGGKIGGNLAAPFAFNAGSLQGSREISGRNREEIVLDPFPTIAVRNGGPKAST